MAHTVVLLGSLDTKGSEYAFVRDRLNAAGIETIVIDSGIMGEPGFAPQIARDAVAQAGGASLAELRERQDRGEAMAAMARGATAIVRDLHDSGAIQGALALGGTGGTSLAAQAFRDLPLGFPRIIVSTAASGDTQAYVGESDLILFPSVVDIAGLNRISRQILTNAADALSGMVLSDPIVAAKDRPLIAASMFGVTTPCVEAARERLESLGYEVVVFHMTGSGGRAMEQLIRQGFFAGVLDLTTTELADHLVGGVFDAGPARLTGAGELGVPQVVSVGALDMVNFGATVPAQFQNRNLYVHNSSVTLMRTTPAENAELGAMVARKLAAATGPTTIVLPLEGISAIAKRGGPFDDPAADLALFDAIREGLRDSAVTIVELDTDINDPAFAHECADRLHQAIQLVAAT